MADWLVVIVATITATTAATSSSAEEAICQLANRLRRAIGARMPVFSASHSEGNTSKHKSVRKPWSETRSEVAAIAIALGPT